MNDLIFNEKNTEQSIRLMICGFTPVYREMLQELFGGDAVFCDTSPDVIISEEGMEPNASGTTVFILGSREGRKKNKIYIQRPADLKKLRCFVLSLARTQNTNQQENSTLTVDSSALTVSLGSKTAHLTSLEFALFHLLYEKRGSTVSREDINRALWQEGEGSNVCDVYICYLRKKLDPLMGKGNIVSVRGAGYMMRK